ncbi:AraC-type DNA-binding protein [Aquipseudomonas alcaligenes]|uniref:AraC-type DNA-binding protein n=2 Tax=Aquipseudomonas alcaligenes TaxID=43263 RepID=A0A1N6NPK7_AQUAC|nr:AraC-type DNA-binding protein [Pseudomonas alcaligenes]
MRYQRYAGAMLDYRMEVQNSGIRIVLEPRFYEPDVAVFYVEEAMASALGIARHLTGLQVTPKQLSLSYMRPAHWARYETVFECTPFFSTSHNFIEFDQILLTKPLATRDDAVAAEVIEMLKDIRGFDQERSELVEGLQREVRKQLNSPPTLNQLADSLNISERTLRRRIEEKGLSYQAIIDQERRARALVLLGRNDLSLAEVAAQSGFSDLRNFRRAFKRWTGNAPSEVRKGLLNTATLLAFSVN